MSHRLVIDITEIKTKRIVVSLESPPSQPGLVSITFSQEGSVMNATISFVSPSTDSTVTSRPVGVVVAGAPEVVVDCMTPQTVPCNPGDVVTATPKGDINPNGQGPAGNPVTATAPGGTTGDVPPMPGELTISFE